MFLLKIFIPFLIIGLFLYSKLLPYKTSLNPKYNSLFNFFDSIFSFLLNGLRKFFKPFQVGPNLAVDMTQIILLVLLLLIYSFIK